MTTKKNALYNMAYRLFSVLLPLVTAPYLSRTVGQHGVGVYEYAWSVSTVFCLIAMLGLENYGVRAIARVKHDRPALDRTFSEIYLMQLLVAGVSLVAYGVYALYFSGVEKPVTLSLMVMSVSCLVNLDWCLMGLDQFRPIALRNTCTKLAAAASVFLLVKSEKDLYLYGLVWSLATLAGCLSCMQGLKKQVTFHLPPLRDALRHLAPCSVLFISVLAVSVYRQMDKVMVGAMAGMEQNGLYANAEKIIYCLSGFISAIGTVMLPKMSRLVQQGTQEAVAAQLRKTMKLMMCMTCALSFGLASVATVFAPLFFGEAFAPAGILMIPLAFTLLPIGFANVVRTGWVLPAGRDKVLIASVCTGAVVNLILNLCLIPALGAMGAVIATLAAEISVPVVQGLMIRKSVPYGAFLKIQGQYVGCGLVMYLTVTLLSRSADNWLSLALMVLLGIATYALACAVLWKITSDRELWDMLPFQKIKKRLFHS